MRIITTAAITTLLLSACDGTAPPEDASSAARTDLSGLEDYDVATRTYKPRDLSNAAETDASRGGAVVPDAEVVSYAMPSGFEHCFPPEPYRGVVRLMLDVTERGEAVNLRVADSDDPCFDRYALRAVSQWRYAPLLIDGQARSRRGVETAITFENAEHGG